MPSPDGERMDALTEAIVRLLRRMDQVEARLARLEGLPSGHASTEERLELHASPVVEALPPQAPAPTRPPSIPAGDTEPGVPPTSPLPGLNVQQGGAQREQQQLETRLGLTWINRIGVLTLVIGVAFFFKYAFDNQWIGETGRVVLGVLIGLVTLVVGDLVWRRGQKVFAQGLCGLGASILYLSFYASFGFYHLLPQAAAFVLMAMLTALSGALALRYDSIAIGALAMLGGYATPLLLSTGQDAPWTFFSYLLLIDVGAVAMARPRRWRPLDLLAFIATVVLYASWFDRWFTPEKRVVGTVAVLAFYALFAFVQWRPVSCAAQVLAGIALVVTWPQATPYLALSLVVGLAGLVMAERVDQSIALLSLVTFWGGYGLWVGLNGEPNETTGILLLTTGFAMYLAWLFLELFVRRREVRIQHLAILALNGIVYYGCAYALLKPHNGAWLGLLAVSVAGVHLVLGISLWKIRAAAGYDARPVLLALGVALGFLTLAVPIQFTGFSITMSWALEAAALTWISRRTQQHQVSVGAAAVYVLVFFRLYAIDAWLPQSHLLVNSRFVTFVVSAISCWLGAWWLKNERLAAAVAYVAGHFILVSTCLLEWNDAVDAAVNPENRVGVFAVGASILMAVYGTILISIGVTHRSALNRLLGLLLMAIVILKLYFYDVWEASRLFRTAAFMFLGLLLLLTSYLYSRYRVAIENWWKDEEASK